MEEKKFDENIEETIAELKAKIEELKAEAASVNPEEETEEESEFIKKALNVLDDAVEEGELLLFE